MVSCSDCAAILDLIYEIAHWPVQAPTINLVRADIVAITARLSRIRNRHVVRQGSGDDASEDTLLYSDGSPPEEE